LTLDKNEAMLAGVGEARSQATPLFSTLHVKRATL
jgi:hypothetical protein